ncbi:MAG: diacylglycerol kinase family protein [Novosphingobium sp.]|nr:diacylglycerol kinase [Novosphingobium sp.]
MAGTAGTSSRTVSGPRVGVVRNPRSHRNRGHEPEAVNAANVLTVAPQTRDELATALAGFAEQGIELLVIDGGDGTVRDVLTRGARVFGTQWPKLAVLPKGKTNALAADLGLPRKWPLADAIDALSSTRTEIRRPMIVERTDRDDIHAMGFILGGGVFNAAIDAGQVAHRYGAFQGFAVAVTAAFGIVQALFGLGASPWRALAPMRIATNPGDHEIPRSSHGGSGFRFACGMSTLGKFPLGMHPFGKAGSGIQYLVIDAPLRRVIALVPALLMGLDRPYLQRLGIHRGAASEIALQLGGNFILDGEAFPPGDYRLRQGPELQFLVP